MLDKVTRQPESISQPTQELSPINIDAPEHCASSINRQEVHIENAEASWAHALNDSQKKLTESPSAELSKSHPSPSTSTDDIEPPLCDRPAVLATDASAGIAARRGQARVPAAEPPNPKFIKNAPTAGRLNIELAYNPGQFAA